MRSTRQRPQTGHFTGGDGPGMSYGYLGSGASVVVLIHGLGARWQVFSPLMRLMAEDYTFYACDLRGHGESDRCSGAYHLEEFTDDVARFIEFLNVGSVDVYGHSLGGWIGMGLAADRPSLVRSLVVADSAIFSTTQDPDLAISYLADLPITMRSLSKSLDQLDPDVMAHFRTGRMLAGYDPGRLLPRIPSATTLIQADPSQGGVMSDDDVTSALELIPRSRVVRMPGIGHGLHVEDAVLVADTMRSAFDRPERK